MNTIRRSVATCLLAMALALPCSAKWTSLDNPRLSSAPDTESTTNVAFNAGGEDVRLFRLVVELDATGSNCVDVAFGLDRDSSGTLERHEVDAIVGWDSGEWFFRDCRSRAEMRTSRPDGHRRLDWRLSLNAARIATSLSATDADGVAFSGAVPATMFDVGWNMMRITSRGLSDPAGSSSCRVDAMGTSIIMR